MSEPRPPAAAVWATLFGALTIGFAPIAVRLSEVGPQATAFWRFVFAALALAPFVLRPASDARAVLADGPLTRIILLAGLLFGMDIVLWHASLVMTSVANATLLSNMTPIMAALGGWLLLREKISRAFALGAGVALAGAAMLSLARRQLGHGLAWGDLLALCSAVWYAAYLLIVRARGQAMSVTTLMFLTTLSAGVVALGAALILREPLMPQTLQGWALLAGLGVIVHVGGQGTIAYGVGRLPITLSTVLLWLQPLAAAGLSWAIFGEALAPLGFAGAALVLAGVWIVQRGRATASRERA